MNKFAIVCFFLAASLLKSDALQLTEAQKSKIYSNLLSGGMECMKDFPLSLDHIKAFRSKQVPDDATANCFANCLYKKLGLLDHSGKLSEKKAMKEAKKIFSEGDEMLTKVEEFVNKCIKVNEAETSEGDKECKRAKLISECFVENSTELGIDITF